MGDSIIIIFEYNKYNKMVKVINNYTLIDKIGEGNYG